MPVVGDFNGLVVVVEDITMTINDLIVQSHQTALDKGWWDDPRDLPHQIALMHSELSEVLEESRAGHMPTLVYYNDDGKPEGIPVELADLLIRVADTCGQYGIDLDKALKEKLAYNKTRPYKHGKVL